MMHKRCVFALLRNGTHPATLVRTVQHALVSRRRPFVHHWTYFDFVSKDTASLNRARIGRSRMGDAAEQLVVILGLRIEYRTSCPPNTMRREVIQPDVLEPCDGTRSDSELR
jgi:hypothetical protein